MSVRVNKAESLFTGLVGSNPPHLPNLVKAVNANAAITTECYDAQWDKPTGAREIAFIFDAALSGPEDTELTTVLIPAHTGVDGVDATLAPAGGLTDVFGPGLLYHLDAMNRASYPGSGTVATDIEGGVDGDLTGSTTHDGVAFVFNGTAGAVDIAKPATLDDLFAGGGTAFFVFNAASDGEGTFGRIVSTEGSGSGVTGWTAHVRDEAGTDLSLAFVAEYTTTDGQWELTGLTLDQWHVVAVRYTSGNVANDPDMFIDGSLGVETETATPAGTYVSDIGENIFVGNREGDDRTFDGQVQRVLLFDRLLSDEEIAQVTRVLSVRPVPAAAPGGGGGLSPIWFFADKLSLPVTADWTVSVHAPLAENPSNSGLHGLLFDDTTEEGCGFQVTIPAGAVSMQIKTLARAVSGPGGAVVAKLLFYEREVSDGVAVTAWSSSIALSDVNLPVTTIFHHLDETDKTLASWGLTAGKTYQIEITRTATGDTLSGDLHLNAIGVEFT